MRICLFFYVYSHHVHQLTGGRIAQYALTLIKESYGIEMKEDEAAYLAYHFVIDELGQQDGPDPGLMTEIVGNIIENVEKSFQIELNEEDWNYQRFLTHLKSFDWYKKVIATNGDDLT